MSAWVFHIDLDQFIAAVEIRRRPELKGMPVVIGGTGDPNRRSVVATASYEARAFGVHSGIPMRIAARKLANVAEAVFLPHDQAAYEAASTEIMETLLAFDDPALVVEVMGWDEAFLGLNTDDPEPAARRIQQAVLLATGLHSSIGLGDTTVRAKTATNFGKPAGIFTLTEANWLQLMGDRPTDALWGVGTKTARRLAALGLQTVRQLAEADPWALAATLGPTMGPHFVGLGRGLGRSYAIAEPWVAKSRSKETTFQQNLRTWPEIQRETAELAQLLMVEVTADGRPIFRVSVKVRFAPFFTELHSRKLPAPTADPGIVSRAALDVLELFDHDRPVRLLGVRVEFAEPS